MSATESYDPYSWTLDNPIVTDTETIEKISFKELQARHVRDISLGEFTVGDFLDIASKLSGVKSSHIDKLSSSDCDEIVDRVAYLFEPSSSDFTGDAANLALKEPIQFGKQAISELTFNKPTAKQKRAMGRNMKLGSLLDIAQALVSQNRRVIDRLGKDDMWEVIYRVIFFLTSGK